MTSQLDAALREADSLRSQPSPLFAAAHCLGKGDPAGRPDHALPGDSAIRRERPQRPTDGARPVANPEQLRNLPIGGNASAGNSGDERVYLFEETGAHGAGAGVSFVWDAPGAAGFTCSAAACGVELISSPPTWLAPEAAAAGSGGAAPVPLDVALGC